MAKKSKARLVVASEEVRSVVDKGFGIDVELKNFTFEDKGIKSLLAKKLETQFGDDTSIKVEGELGSATVTQSEKFSIKGEAEKVAEVREAAENGLLLEAVKLEQEINVPVADREKAAKILQAAGIKATTSVKMTIDPAELRILRDSETASVESSEAKSVLDSVVERAVSYRVKYEKN